MRRMHCAATVIIAAFFSSQAAAQSTKALSDLSPDAHIARRGGTLVPAGRLEIDGHRMTCGESPTVLDPNERDFGSAPPGFLILNPDLFAGLATSVKLWIFNHECAHQTVGSDEVKADCVAVQRGRREGWLTPAGLDQICEFMRPAREDQMHFNGVHRCELMRQCFQETNGVRSR
jgi:hypothetical protein